MRNIKLRYWAYVLLSLIAILLSVSIIGCSAEKRCENHARKAEKLGCLKNDSTFITIHDTTFKEVLVHDSSEITIDVRIRDSLRITDTCFSKQRTDQYKNMLKIKPIVKSDSNYTFKIWLDHGVLKYNLYIKPCVSSKTSLVITKTITRTNNNIPWYYWFFPAILFLLLIYFLLVKRR